MATKKKIIVAANQTIFDIAKQEYGSVEGVFQLIVDNSLESVNDLIDAGDELVISTNLILNKDVNNFYTRTARKPASADNEVGEEEEASFSEGFTLGFES